MTKTILQDYCKFQLVYEVTRESRLFIGTPKKNLFTSLAVFINIIFVVIIGLIKNKLYVYVPMKRQLEEIEKSMMRTGTKIEIGL